jgi:hypothetical protein
MKHKTLKKIILVKLIVYAFMLMPLVSFGSFTSPATYTIFSDDGVRQAGGNNLPNISNAGLDISKVWWTKDQNNYYFKMNLYDTRNLGSYKNAITYDTVFTTLMDFQSGGGRIGSRDIDYIATVGFDAWGVQYWQEYIWIPPNQNSYEGYFLAVRNTSFDFKLVWGITPSNSSLEWKIPINTSNGIPALTPFWFGGATYDWVFVYSPPYTNYVDITENFAYAPVPIPPTVLLFGSGLAGLFGLGRLRKGK